MSDAFIGVMKINASSYDTIRYDKADIFESKQNHFILSTLALWEFCVVSKGIVHEC